MSKPFPVSLVTLDDPKPRDPTPTGPRARADATAVQTCEACGETKPMDQWTRYLEVMGDLDSDTAPQMLCNYCSVYGPPLEDPLHALTPNETRALEHLASGGNVSSAAKIIGISRDQLRSLMSGRDKHIFRAAYQRLLLSMGLTPTKLALFFDDAVTSEKMQWNPERGAFEAFPDTANRLKAVALTQKTMQLDPPSEMAARDTGQPLVEFNFVTNLDGSSQLTDKGYTIIQAESTEEE